MFVCFLLHSEHFSSRLQHLNSLLCQAAAAARIAGKDDIFVAAGQGAGNTGNFELVKDHVIVDSACVHKKDR
jgi:hypothetical protein